MFSMWHVIRMDCSKQERKRLVETVMVHESGRQETIVAVISQVQAAWTMLTQWR